MPRTLTKTDRQSYRSLRKKYSKEYFAILTKIIILGATGLLVGLGIKAIVHGVQEEDFTTLPQVQSYKNYTNKIQDSFMSYLPPEMHKLKRLLVEGTTDCEEDTIMVIPYALMLLYAFVGVAIICDEYFEPSLTEISERLELSEDVAGATFMAAGSSAPELFTSLLDAFGPGNSIGVGTIVGSAMFNILIIVALTAAVTKGRVKLDWRPIFRDVSFYLYSIGLLVIYVVLGPAYCYLPDFVAYKVELEGRDWIRQTELATLSSNITEDVFDVSCIYSEVGMVAGVIFTLSYLFYILFMVYNERILSKCGPSLSGKVQDEGQSSPDEKPKEEEEENDDGGVFDIPDGFIEKITWIILFPINVLFAFTIPNCEDDKYKKYYLISFFSCMFWLAGLCYVMVILASEIGCLLGINPVIMGVTLLAAGTSVPDAIASMVVARKGMADMAIANAVGSNVFDILLGLGVPWFFAEVLISRRMHIRRDKVAEYIFILIGTVFVYVLSIALNKWSMSKRLGYVYLSLYGGFLIYIALTEI
eukprot:augustus_masked-scaffold_19-processed-gene-0.34-mRNA-1 protein AED:0.06 eAED:0.06 QI:0/-1/0/1/-1/1/1/0/530